jgi:hypothetical protein
MNEIQDKDRLHKLALKIADDEFGFHFIDNMNPLTTQVWSDYHFIELIERILTVRKKEL